MSATILPLNAKVAATLDAPRRYRIALIAAAEKVAPAHKAFVDELVAGMVAAARSGDVPINDIQAIAMEVTGRVFKTFADEARRAQTELNAMIAAEQRRGET